MAQRHCITWIVLFVLSGNASAAEFFTNIGKMQFDAPADGTYWQSRHTHEMDMENPYLRAGFAFDVLPRTKLSVSGFYLGQWSIDAVTTQLDKPDKKEGYADMSRRHNPKAANGCFGECEPLNRWKVSDTISGIALTAKVTVVKSINLEIECGPTLNFHNLDMKVTDASGNKFDGYQADGLETTTWGNMCGVTAGTKTFSAGVTMYDFPGNWKNEDFVNDGGQMPIGVRSGLSAFISYKW